MVRFWLQIKTNCMLCDAVLKCNQNSFNKRCVRSHRHIQEVPCPVANPGIPNPVPLRAPWS